MDGEVKGAARLIALGLVIGSPSGSPHASTPVVDEKTIVHVLNRMTFGPRDVDVARVRALGLQRYIDEQLHPERLPDGGAGERLAQLRTIGLSSREIADRFERPLLEAHRNAKQLA